MAANAIIVDPKEEFLLDVIEYYKRLTTAEAEFSLGSGDSLPIYRYARTSIILLICAVESQANQLLIKKGELSMVKNRVSIHKKLKKLNIDQDTDIYKDFCEINKVRGEIVHEKGKIDYSILTSDTVYKYYGVCGRLISSMYFLNKINLPKAPPLLNQ